MKHVRLNHPVLVIMLLLHGSLIGCREFTTLNRPYQRVIINDFSVPFRTVLPPYDGTPSSLRLRVSGTISQSVILAVDQFDANQKQSPIRRDTLAAGTYTNKSFSGDYYSNRKTELVVTARPGATGSLTIDWSRQ